MLKVSKSLLVNHSRGEEKVAQKRPVDVVVTILRSDDYVNRRYVRNRCYLGRTHQRCKRSSVPIPQYCVCPKLDNRRPDDCGILEYAKRRPIDNEATWGEANVWSVYVFLYLFWIYGVVPHQWLTFTKPDYLGS